MTESSERLLTLSAQIVSAHVGHHETPSEALPGLIRDVYETLASFAPVSRPAAHDHDDDRPAAAEARPASRATPRVGGKMGAIADDHLVCLEDGLTMKMLKRHLITVHGLTPDQYRVKWNLPSDYPMVAANYAKLRSSLAKESGLGLRPEARRLRMR